MILESAFDRVDLRLSKSDRVVFVDEGRGDVGDDVFKDLVGAEASFTGVEVEIEKINNDRFHSSPWAF